MLCLSVSLICHTPCSTLITRGTTIWVESDMQWLLVMFKGKHYRTQLQLGNGAVFAASYIQVYV
ncbi:hypothetical protein K2173_014458 [Erythroxylum novogranatense]|uniref:Uncharacterized protein n=1 Tax=Erythroxylum novogranatense TaxID=1862640 RepID=A0AAV8S5I0_9ROSI|nr:hypothetical protein K2173_014458 [Erythroxylum novogranatense]